MRLQLLRRESSRFTTEHGQFQFVQSAVRQVAYGTLSRRDRKAEPPGRRTPPRGRGRPGGELAPIIAQHYLEALDAVPDEGDRADLAAAAVNYLRRAAARPVPSELRPRQPDT